MIKPPTMLTRRSVFRASAGLSCCWNRATRLLTPVSAQSEGTGQTGAEAKNGDGFYRFQDRRTSGRDSR